MEAVKQFEIQLDLSDRWKMYDYGKGKVYKRPGDAKQWDLGILRQNSTVEEIDADDENAMLQIHNMDRVLQDKRWLEKKDGKPHESEEEVEFNTGCHLPKRVMPVYHPGETIIGKVILETTEPIDADKFLLKMRGRAGVSIRIYHQRGYYDHRAHDDYIHETLTLWEKVDGQTSVTDQFSLLGAASGPARSKLIPPGHHEFPFEFRLPEADKTCPSVPQLVPSTHNYAHVSFRLKAVIEKGNTFGRGNLVTHRPIWLEKPYDIAQDKSDFHSVSVQETLDTGVAFWKSGSITCTAKLPRAAFVKGEKVPVTIEIDNKSKSEVHTVTARILIHGRARGGTKCKALTPTMPINVKGTKMKEGPVGVGMCPVFKWELPLEFCQSSVDDLLIPAGNLEDCSLIDIKYHVKIELKRKGLHRNLELNIPIKIGTENSASEYM